MSTGRCIKPLGGNLSFNLRKHESKNCKHCAVLLSKVTFSLE